MTNYQDIHFGTNLKIIIHRDSEKKSINFDVLNIIQDETISGKIEIDKVNKKHVIFESNLEDLGLNEHEIAELKFLVLKKYLLI